ncbi:condensation domain-containing protein, partial [Lysobacter sp. ESA13C]|uniref:condensation domain-containing protein n=1 Tax=Lysobacter sp. ESA13C TaxID=2862676 RepID=UPI001CBEA854
MSNSILNASSHPSKWSHDDALQAQASFWKLALEGAPDLLALPGDRPRPVLQENAGGFVRCCLDEELTRGVRALSQRHGVTQGVTLLASWAAVLSRLSGQDEVVIGMPATARARHSNALALRIDVRAAETVSALLTQVQSRAAQVQQHQDLPFEQVVELVASQRSLSYNPIFQVLFDWRDSVDEPLLPLVRLDLTLSLSDAGEVIAGGIEYASALFDATTIERYIECWRTLLREMVTDAQRPVSALRLLPEAERQLVVETWNATDAPYPVDRLVHEWFEA